MDCPPKKKGCCTEVAACGGSTVIMLWFNFILGLNFIFLCFGVW